MAPVMLYDKIISFTVRPPQLNLTSFTSYFRWCVQIKLFMKLKSLKLKEHIFKVWFFLKQFSIYKVMQRQFLRSGRVLASFKLDIATVMQQPGERQTQLLNSPTNSCMYVFLRMSILSQVGCADWPWRHGGQLQGIHQVRHQHHHQGKHENVQGIYYLPLTCFKQIRETLSKSQTRLTMMMMTSNRKCFYVKLSSP